MDVGALDAAPEVPRVPQDNTSLKLSAVLEAGLVITCTLLGVHVERVELDATAPEFEQAEDGREYGRIVTSDGQRLRTKEQVMVLLAGHAAVAIHKHWADESPMIERVMQDGATDDFVAAMKRLREVLPERQLGPDADQNIGLAIASLWTRTV